MYDDILGTSVPTENPCEEIDLPAEQTIITEECDCGDECDGSGKCHDHGTGTPPPDNKKDPWGVTQDNSCDGNCDCEDCEDDGCAGC